MKLITNDTKSQPRAIVRFPNGSEQHFVLKDDEKKPLMWAVPGAVLDYCEVVLSKEIRGFKVNAISTAKLKEWAVSKGATCRVNMDYPVSYSTAK